MRLCSRRAVAVQRCEIGHDVRGAPLGWRKTLRRAVIWRCASCERSVAVAAQPPLRKRGEQAQNQERLGLWHKAHNGRARRQQVAWRRIGQRALHLLISQGKARRKDNRSR